MAYKYIFSSFELAGANVSDSLPPSKVLLLRGVCITHCTSLWFSTCSPGF